MVPFIYQSSRNPDYRDRFFNTFNLDYWRYCCEQNRVHCGSRLRPQVRNQTTKPPVALTRTRPGWVLCFSSVTSKAEDMWGGLCSRTQEEVLTAAATRNANLTHSWTPTANQAAQWGELRFWWLFLFFRINTEQNQRGNQIYRGTEGRRILIVSLCQGLWGQRSTQQKLDVVSIGSPKEELQHFQMQFFSFWALVTPQTITHFFPNKSSNSNSFRVRIQNIINRYAQMPISDHEFDLWI